MEEWEKLGEYDEVKASMIKSLLEENGIPVLVRQSDYAMPVIFGSAGIVTLFVPTDKYREAKELVENLEEG